MTLKLMIPVLCTLALSAPALAFEPQEICGLVPCTSEMKAIGESFQSTSPVAIAEGAVYSGVCYYLSGATRPEYAHAGLAVMTPNAGVTEYRGLFSFYGKPSDYAGMDYATAAERVKSSKPANVLRDAPKYSGYRNLNGTADLNYWFGMSADQSRMSLLSVWVFDGSVGQVAFCDMKRH